MCVVYQRDAREDYMGMTLFLALLVNKYLIIDWLNLDNWLHVITNKEVNWTG